MSLVRNGQGKDLPYNCNIPGSSRNINASSPYQEDENVYFPVATIGALAIGIPTFGVAAGAGMVLGGAIGGLVGVAEGGKTSGISI